MALAEEPQYDVIVHEANRSESRHVYKRPQREPPPVEGEIIALSAGKLVTIEKIERKWEPGKAGILRCRPHR